MKLTLPKQIAAQAEFMVNNLERTDYQYTEEIDIGRVEALP